MTYYNNVKVKYDSNEQQEKPIKRSNLGKENMITTNIGEVLIKMSKDKRYIKITENLLQNIKAQLEEEMKKDVSE